MEPRIYCLMTGGGALSDSDRDMLFYTALGMATEKLARRAIKTDGCEGEVTTDFKPSLIGAVGGIEFAARLDMDDGTKTVRFIVRTRDLEGIEDGVWVPVIPVTVLEPGPAELPN